MTTMYVNYDLILYASKCAYVYIYIYVCKNDIQMDGVLSGIAF